MDQGHGLSIEAIEQVMELWTTPIIFYTKVSTNHAIDRKPTCGILGKQIV